MSYEVKMMTVAGIQKMVCPICGKGTLETRNGDIESLSAQARCLTCSSSFSFEHEPNGKINMWNISVRDFSKYSDAVNVGISEKKEYEALKTLFNLFDIKVVKRYPIESEIIKANGKEIVMRRRSEKPIVELITPYGVTHWNVLFTLTEKEYEEKYRFLFEKEKADV